MTTTVINDWHDLDAVRTDLSGDFELGQDLDSDTDGYDDHASETANDGDGWEPIGDSDNPFTGSFDGQGYEINDLYIDRSNTDYVGLFGYMDTGGVVENVGVVDVNITGDGEVGGLVGRNNGYVSDSFSTGSVAGGGWDVGGLVGVTDGDVSDSYSTGSVTGGSVVGGLVGGNYGGNVENSYSTGSVTGDDYVGGLVGWNTEDVSGSYWNTETSGQDTSDGGEGRTTDEMTHIYHRKLSFDGDGDYVEIDYSDTFDNLIDGMTVSAWIYPYDGADRIVAFWETGDDNGQTFILNVEEEVDGDNDGVRFLVRGSDGGGYIASTPFTDGYENWYHVVGVYDKENVRVYLDSVETIGDSYSENLGKRDGEMWIGQGGSSVSPPMNEFDGKIDDVRLYDRALSESEINDVMNNRYIVLGDEIGHWKLNEGEDGTITVGEDTFDVEDSSGNDNHGSNVGAMWVGSYIGWNMSTSGEDTWLSGDHSLVTDHEDNSGYPALSFQQEEVVQLVLTDELELTDVYDTDPIFLVLTDALNLSDVDSYLLIDLLTDSTDFTDDYEHLYIDRLTDSLNVSEEKFYKLKAFISDELELDERFEDALTIYIYFSDKIGLTEDKDYKLIHEIAEPLGLTESDEYTLIDSLDDLIELAEDEDYTFIVRKEDELKLDEDDHYTLIVEVEDELGTMEEFEVYFICAVMLKQIELTSPLKMKIGKSGGEEL